MLVSLPTKNTLKKLLFWIVVVELVIIYYALTDDYASLGVSFVEGKLHNSGYLFSVERPIKFFAKLLIPSVLILRYFGSSGSKRERMIESIQKFYDKITTLQLTICLFLLAIFGFYVHKLYAFLYKKVSKPVIYG